MTVEKMKCGDLSLHDEALTTPRMQVEQFEALKADIEVKGQLEPVLLHRAKIVDGRHRWLVLQELGIEDIMVIKMPYNSTIRDIKDAVRSKETRRHETPAQLAVTAYRLTLAEDLTQQEASNKVGANRKRVSEAKKIAATYQRPDILEVLFNGEKFNTGTESIPFWTDSLGTILKWLAEHGTLVGQGSYIGIEPRTELTEDEQVIVNKYMNALSRESIMVKAEVAKQAYAMAKGDE